MLLLNKNPVFYEIIKTVFQFTSVPLKIVPHAMLGTHAVGCCAWFSASVVPSD
jgi:hypothetical protein